MRSQLYEQHKKKADRQCNRAYLVDKDFGDLEKVPSLASKLLLRKLCERLYFELQQSEHLVESKIDSPQINALIRVQKENRESILARREIVPWLNKPKNFDETTIHQVWIKFQKSNSLDQVNELIGNWLYRIKLQMKIAYF
jgi:hypothetical protein